jgi:hypothetical protein
MINIKRSWRIEAARKAVLYEWRGPKAMREPLWIRPADGCALSKLGPREK